MIAWYSRARSWFNNSISSERDILNTSRSRFIFQKRFSSGLSAGIDVIFGLTFRFFMCATGVTLTVPIASGIKLFKKAQPGTLPPAQTLLLWRAGPASKGASQSIARHAGYVHEASVKALNTKRRSVDNVDGWARPSWRRALDRR